MSATTQFRGHADDVADRAAQSVNETGNAAAAAVRDASRKVTAAVNDFGDRASSATQELTRRVEQQPLSSVAIAVGTGFVLGLLLGRR
jgi:ElaB/YqjD/DUF883 family membrane-anchored ribosome-binding protein